VRDRAAERRACRERLVDVNWVVITRCVRVRVNARLVDRPLDPHTDAPGAMIVVRALIAVPAFVATS
jgi:hypothetical protein